MGKVILFSFHHYLSKRKAGFHWIAASLVDMGWDVLFVTTPLSPFSILIGDYRWDYTKFFERNRLKKYNDHVSYYSYAPVFSPLSQTGNFLIDNLSPFFLPLYKKWIPKNLRNEILDADIIIFESTAAILLFDLISDINLHAKKIYRVSDSLDILKVHDSIIQYEKSIISKFDLVSVPSQSLVNRFNSSNVYLMHHGIDKKSFSERKEQPKEFRNYEKNFVFVGNSFVDSNFIKIASDLFPSYGFHIIGPIDKFSSNTNVQFYGEMPFQDTISYVMNADVGLQIRKMEIGLGTLSDSLKILQYTWCKLPIIAPYGLNSSRNHVKYYLYDSSESIRDAVREAIEYDRTSIDTSDIFDWMELTKLIISKVS